ncbi:glutathione synthase, partial [Pelagibacterales bacterium SAG-MED49]|nr:glutathione synthase [Pelagibacterales bacterium SAG-MED49]
MINKIVAVQGNHPSKLNPTTDTSVFLANEIQNKKYKIFYYNPKDLSVINSKVIAKGFFIEFNYSKKKFFKILKKQKLDLSRCKFILIRQDPPFNLEYISATYILDTIKNKVNIINNPTSIRNVSEKLYSVKYQKYMPSTIFTQNIDEIKKFFKKNKKVILKPIHSFSGNNIHLLNKFNLKLVQKFIRQHDHIMCQKYLPKISK